MGRSGSAPSSAGKRYTSQPYLQAQIVHYKPRVSVLDKELTTVSYHGLVNFLLLLLSATLVRLAIENYMKYGILVSIPGASVESRDWLMMLAGLLAVLASLLAAYAIERAAIPATPGRRCAQGSPLPEAGIAIEDRRTLKYHIANLVCMLVGPSCITYFGIYQPALGTLVMASACIMFLKLYSLAATNFDLRRAFRLGDTRMDSDPMCYSRVVRGQLVIPGAGGERLPPAPHPSNEPSRRPIPTATSASFSQNARALDDSIVSGNDRTDAKADALPRPRLRNRATTASEVLRRVANSASPEPGAPWATSTANRAQSEDRAAVGSDDELYAAGPRRRRGSGGRPARDTAEDAADPCTASDGPDQDATPRAAPQVSRYAIHYAVAYPDNVSLGNFGYFWLAPTLCYQPSYPRSASPIRKSFLAKRLAELVIIGLAMHVVIQQYAVPTLAGSVQAIDTRDGFWLSERVLKLSVISAIVWFLGFYAIFHAGLNALAEMLRFADRAFYLDWWNSVDLAAYWREWNLPIHYFCKRHIMVPLVSTPLSLPVHVGVLLTFLISAIMHELLFGIPTHCLRGYSFIGMMVQIPLIQLTQWLVRWRGPESGLGNAVFWISFCIVGQPLGVVQYYHTWVKNNP
ncbi:hypothetical protein LPJ61_000495 [Coemansia biformis]|uniref:O-acyltransferase n=1 Tax=Coemansia biformis TaxID=1286918 RepID=A0A9W8CYZ9_9FUNG|nr:hypothetical protein LPJ61_000495 [Coemansia biformis]